MKHTTTDFQLVDELIDETVAFFHILQEFAARTHKNVEITAAKRGVLRSLKKLGAQTVPQMARARPVSRQFIQTLVNQLDDTGLVEAVANPAHKRSNLIMLTPAGDALLAQVTEKEQRIVSRFALSSENTELQLAASVLKELRGAFAAFLAQPANNTEEIGDSDVDKNLSQHAQS